MDKKTEIRTDYSQDKPIDYGLHDNGKTVIETNIIGTRTFRHQYSLIAVYDTAGQPALKANNRITHSIQDWIMEQNDNQNYPPVTGGTIHQIVSSESVFMGFVGDTTHGRYQTVFFIDYKED